MQDSNRCDNARNGQFHNDMPYHSQVGLLSETNSPLQREFKKHEVKNSIQQLGRISFIPFMDGGDATNRVIIEMLELSTIQSACKNLYRSYMQANDKIELEKRTGFLGSKEIEISDSEKEEYSSQLFEAFGEQGLDDLQKAIDREIENYLVYGNNITEIILFQQGSEKMGRIISYDFNYFRYEMPRDNTDDWGKYGFLCEDFKNVNLKSNVAYQKYSMYPNFTEHEDGTLRCLLHTFKKEAGREWYGLPMHFSSIYSQYIQFQKAKYTSVALENKCLSPLIIEKEERQQDIKTDDESSLQLAQENRRFRDMYALGGSISNISNKAPLLIMERPYGASPSTFKDIPSNVDTDFYDLVHNQTSEQIMMSWGVHSGLFQRSNSALSGGDLFTQIADTFYWTQVKSAQDKCMRGINTALKKVFEFVGYPNPNNLIMALPKPYFIEKLKPISEPPPQNNSQPIA